MREQYRFPEAKESIDKYYTEESQRLRAQDYRKEGWRAAKKGARQSDNPYSQGSEGYFDWLDGWFSWTKRAAHEKEAREKYLKKYA